MPLFVGAIDAGGDQPTAPGTPTATGGNAVATVSFAAPSYLGKTGTVAYTVTSSPGGITASGISPITVTGLTNGTAYTFTVRGTTDYGVVSNASAASNSVTPAAPPAPPPPPPPPPGPPPPPPCSCAPQPWPGNCTRVFPNTCDGTYTFEYYDCGCSQTCPGSGGYNPQQISGSCGYVAPAPVPGCSACVYTVTGQSQFACGCEEIRGFQKQKFYVVTSYSTTCTPDPCVGCSCPQSSTGPCTLSNFACFQ